MIALSLGWQSGCLEPFAPQETTTPKKQAGTALAKQAGRKDDPARSGLASGKNKKKKKEKPKQTYQQAWELMCKAERLSGVDPKAARQARGSVVSDWIVKHISNKRARYWLIEYGQKKKRHRKAIFDAEIKRLSLAPCPLGDLLIPQLSPEPANQPAPASHRAPAGQPAPASQPAAKGQPTLKAKRKPVRDFKRPRRPPFR